MKYIFAFLFTSLLIPAMSQSQFLFPPLGGQGVAPDFASGELLVMLYSNADMQRLQTSLQTINGINTKFGEGELLSADMHCWLFKFDANAIGADVMLTAVNRSPFVKMVQFNHYGIQERIVPNDPNYKDQWAHHNQGQDPYYPSTTGDMQTQEAWDINTGLNGITKSGDTMVVAVIDGGIKYAHEDLRYFVNYHEIAGNGIDDDGNGYIDDINGYDGLNNDMSVAVSDHGTHVAGIIGAVGNNGKGVAGICWGVKIMPIQGLYSGSATNSQKESTVLRSYGYILAMRKLYNKTNGAKGAFVVATNSSFGVDYGQPAQFPLWCAFYDSLGMAGILSATSTTNGTVDVDVAGDIPTGCTSPYMIGVGRTNPDDSQSSGYGTKSVDLGAPGFWIYSTSAYNPPYVRMTGTSMSSPAVAGAIALMYAEACTQMMDDYKLTPDLIALQVKSYLLGAVDTVGVLKNKFLTGGRMNIEKALQAVQNYNCLHTSAAETETNNLVSVYPNPVSSVLYVKTSKIFESYEGSLEVYNLLGEKIISNDVKPITREIKLKVSGIPAGYYFIRLSDNTGNSCTNRFIKE